MITVKARFDGRVFVPEEPVNLPVGQVLEIVIPQANGAMAEKTALQELQALLEREPVNPDWPSDGAAQHDHYLYGTPKNDP